MSRFEEIQRKNIELTKKEVKESVTKDILIVQAVSCVNELNKCINTLVKRLREFYAYYLPEIDNRVEDNEEFIKEVISNDRKALLKRLNLNEEESMGRNFSEDEISFMLSLTKEISSLYSLKKEAERYIESLMKELCPNMLEITGALIGARLIELGGSIKKMATLSSSQIQLLGAEKALFRHLSRGARCPKYGIIHEHPFIQKADRKDHGKVARMLGDKISLAIKVDYFKGEFIGDKLRKEIEEKIKN